jgi:hypothetical protein
MCGDMVRRPEQLQLVEAHALDQRVARLLMDATVRRTDLKLNE